MLKSKKKIISSIKKEIHDKFSVYLLDDKYSFIHFDISDRNEFYEEMFDYFFSEEQLLKYIENKSSLRFVPNLVNYTLFYKHLGLYIDSENKEMELGTFEKNIFEILKQEYEIKQNKIGKLIIRLDKMGRIGEYLFNSLLWNYFNFDCIIPKVHLTTDRNMSVYGIDCLFYSSHDDLLLFGESKLTVNLDNGVKLIKESLKQYESQISEEYELVLSNRFYKNNLHIFNDKYGDYVEQSINIKEFINLAKIKKIGIPVFIAHGQEVDAEVIFDKFLSIKKNKMFGLQTEYYFISIPVMNKSKLITIFTKKIREKRDWYEKQSNAFKSTGS
jgi:hypothetical protein